MYPLMLCQMLNIESMIRGNALAPNQVQFITMHRYDFQTKVGLSKCWLSAIVGLLVPLVIPIGLVLRCNQPSPINGMSSM